MTKSNVGVLFGTILLVAGLRVAKGPFYPNVEPIMLFTIVTALAYGPRAGGIIGAGALIASDIMMGLPGPWTLYTGLSYGLIGLAAGILGSWKRSWRREELTAVAFLATIFYDSVTATFWGLQTMQPLLVVYAAQVPFTLLHLSNCALVYVFAPEMMKFLNYAKDFSLQKMLKGLRLNA